MTGAAGGVGSMAISLLADKGWRVIASTGRRSETAYLKTLGADEIIDRATLSAPGKPLGKEQWAAAVDSVGSTTLANVLAQTRYGGAVAACGLAGGMDRPGRSRRSSCAASHSSGSTASIARRSVGSKPGGAWRSISTATSSRP